MAPLLPKLRGQFAEFLNNASLAHLRILSSSTCVGLRYGHLYTISTSFSRQCASWKFVTYFSLYLSIRVFPLPRFPSTPVSLASFKYISGAGISTCCPSDTPFGLSLGPDLPWADEPSPGNLSLMVIGILTQYRYLHRHSHFHPLHDSFRYRFADDGTLPYHFLKSATSVLYLAPVNFRRGGTRLVSCYALFK